MSRSAAQGTGPRGGEPCWRDGGECWGQCPCPCPAWTCPGPGRDESGAAGRALPSREVAGGGESGQRALGVPVLRGCSERRRASRPAEKPPGRVASCPSARRKRTDGERRAPLRSLLEAPVPPPRGPAAGGASCWGGRSGLTDAIEMTPTPGSACCRPSRAARACVYVCMCVPVCASLYVCI